jgi:hypothetical protein
MTNEPTRHLSADQLSAALVAEQLLPADAARHLSGCPQCRQALEAAAAAITRLAAQARGAVPVPGRRLVLPDTAPRPMTWQGWRRGLVAAAALLVLAAGSVALHPEWLPGGAGGGTRLERLVTALDHLKQLVLPSSDFSVAGDEPLQVDDEFMDFLIPNGDETPLSIVTEAPETRPC